MNVFLILKLVFMFPDLDRGHKKQKDSLETRAVLIEISHLCWNLPRDHFKKTCFP